MSKGIYEDWISSSTRPEKSGTYIVHCYVTPYCDWNERDYGEDIEEDPDYVYIEGSEEWDENCGSREHEIVTAAYYNKEKDSFSFDIEGESSYETTGTVVLNDYDKESAFAVHVMEWCPLPKAKNKVKERHIIFENQEYTAGTDCPAIKEAFLFMHNTHMKCKDIYKTSNVRFQMNGFKNLVQIKSEDDYDAYIDYMTELVIVDEVTLKFNKPPRSYKGPGWYAEINEPYRKMPEKGLICVNSMDELVTLSDNR